MIKLRVLLGRQSFLVANSVTVKSQNLHHRKKFFRTHSSRESADLYGYTQPMGEMKSKAEENFCLQKV